MAKNDNINIKLEVCKDKNSGKLSIRAHFDSNAPNFAMDKEGYFWIPTFEEKEFINEAFQLIPIDTSESNKEKMQRIEENLDTKPVTHFPKVEKQKETSIFTKSNFETKDEHLEKNVFEKREDIQNKRYETEDEEEEEEEKEEEPSYNEKEGRKKEERLIVEADDEAIEAAIKRRIEDDKSFVEVDEQTIIDRVLSQKKKGKWSKK